MTTLNLKSFSATCGIHRIGPSLGLLLFTGTLAVATPPKEDPGGASAHSSQGALVSGPGGQQTPRAASSEPPRAPEPITFSFFSHGEQRQLENMKAVWDRATREEREAIRSEAGGEDYRVKELLCALSQTGEVDLIKFLFNEVLAPLQRRALIETVVDLFEADFIEDPLHCALNAKQAGATGFWSNVISEERKEEYFRYALLSSNCPEMAVIVWNAMAPATQINCIAEDHNTWVDYEKT